MAQVLRSWRQSMGLPDLDAEWRDKLNEATATEHRKDYVPR